MRKRRARAKTGKSKGEKDSGRTAMYVSMFLVAAVLLWVWSRPSHTPSIGSVTQTTEGWTSAATHLAQPSAIVGLVGQFYNQSPSFTEETSKLLRARGLSVRIHKSDEVTVEFYRRLPTYGYRLIILRVHSGISEWLPEHPTFLFTSEPYSASKYVFEQLSDEIMGGVLNPESDEESVFTVGPMFVRVSIQGNFDGAAIILSSCLSLCNEHLAKALMDKGASVFVSWNEKVTLEHTDRATLVRLKALIVERTSVEQAVRRVMKEVGSDPTHESYLKYYPSSKGASSIWLVPQPGQQVPSHWHIRPVPIRLITSRMDAA